MKKLEFVVVIAFLFPNEVFAAEFQTIDHLASQSQVEDFSGRLGAAQGAGARPLSALTLGLIKDFEGWQPNAYNDPSGYCTIGYGHLIALQRCETIDLKEFRIGLTTDTGDALLEKDTQTARVAVQQLVNPGIDLDDDQFGALSAFVFNIGKSNFAGSTLLRLINQGLSQEAAGQFGRWIKSGGVVLEGLQYRRACEKKLFEEQLSFDMQGVFQRSSCQEFNAASVISNPVDVHIGE